VSPGKSLGHDAFDLVARNVFSPRDAGKIVWIVVEGVFVDVVNVVAGGDWPVNRLPNLFVKAPQTLLAVSDSWDEVGSLRVPLGVGISAIKDSVESDFLNVLHEASISEYRNASSDTQPLLSVQMG
jgi:hypothetical protein